MFASLSRPAPVSLLKLLLLISAPALFVSGAAERLRSRTASSAETRLDAEGEGWFFSPAPAPASTSGAPAPSPIALTACGDDAACQQAVVQVRLRTQQLIAQVNAQVATAGARYIAELNQSVSHAVVQDSLPHSLAAEARRVRFDNLLHHKLEIADNLQKNLLAYGYQAIVNTTSKEIRVLQPAVNASAFNAMMALREATVAMEQARNTSGTATEASFNRWKGTHDNLTTWWAAIEESFAALNKAQGAEPDAARETWAGEQFTRLSADIAEKSRIEAATVHNEVASAQHHANEALATTTANMERIRQLNELLDTVSAAATEARNSAVETQSLD